MPLGNEAVQDNKQMHNQTIPASPWHPSMARPTNGSGSSPHNSKDRVGGMECCLRPPCCADLELVHMHFDGAQNTDRHLAPLGEHSGGRDHQENKVHTPWLTSLRFPAPYV